MPFFNRANLSPLDVNNRGELRHDKPVYHVEGISNATAQDMKRALYQRAVLNSNLWNAMLVLLARFNFRDLLLRFGQAAQVLLLDLLRAERRWFMLSST